MAISAPSFFHGHGDACRPGGCRWRSRRAARPWPRRSGRAAAPAPRSWPASWRPAHRARWCRRWSLAESCLMSPLMAVLAGALARHHDVDAMILQDALQLAHIGKARHIGEGERFGREQRHDHQRQRGILGARNLDGAVEAVAAADRIRSMKWDSPCEARVLNPESPRPASLSRLGANKHTWPNWGNPILGACPRPAGGRCLHLGLAPGDIGLQRLGQPLSSAPPHSPSWCSCSDFCGTPTEPSSDGVAPAPQPVACVRPHHARRCRSSVVEHSLGKGEVESSILSGSTSFRT